MDKGLDPTDLAAPESRVLGCPPARYGLIAFGWICVGLGMLGVVLPVLPTTIFLIVALWAFSRSSVRFHRWLYRHPRLGPRLRAWQAHCVIPIPAKCLALGMMLLSLVYVSLVAEGWMLPVGLATGSLLEGDRASVPALVDGAIPVPTAVAVNWLLFVPTAVPSVQLPTDAEPPPSVAGVRPVALPPPAETANVICAPATGLPARSTSDTVGATATAWSTSSIDARR